MTKWSAELSSNNPPWASNVSNGFTKRVAGIKDATGTAEGKYDVADPIEDHLREGTIITLQLHANTSQFWQFTAIVDKLSIECDINSGDPMSWSIDWSNSGGEWQVLN